MSSGAGHVDVRQSMSSIGENGPPPLLDNPQFD